METIQIGSISFKNRFSTEISRIMFILGYRKYLFFNVLDITLTSVSLTNVSGIKIPKQTRVFAPLCPSTGWASECHGYLWISWTTQKSATSSADKVLLLKVPESVAKGSFGVIRTITRLRPLEVPQAS
jgi:hypothetical protein